MRLTKKAQAATEFIMTYGWAILVVIIAVAALAYFGVLNPGGALPEKCAFPAGMDCVDKPSISTVAGANKVELVLVNNNGVPIGLTRVTGTDDCAVVSNFTPITPARLKNNEQFILTINCNETLVVPKGSRFKSDFGVVWQNNQTGLSHTALGQVRGVVSS